MADKNNKTINNDGEEILDIYSKGEYPANVLSNFHPKKFVFDGVECASMEGFLQSLKFKNEKRQREICALVGIDAKNKGQHKFLWKITGNVYWLGKRYKRKGEEFTRLIFRAYRQLYSQNEDFRLALQSAKGKKIIHSIGKNKKGQTILTAGEFINCILNINA